MTEEPKPKEIKLKITLPTKEDVIQALKDKYPGIKVEEEEVHVPETT